MPQTRAYNSRIHVLTCECINSSNFIIQVIFIVNISYPLNKCFSTKNTSASGGSIKHDCNTYLYVMIMA